MIAEASVHTPVLYNEVLENLLSSPSLQASECAHEAATFLDCTVGGAGHLEGILQASEDFHVVGVDRDQRALDRAEERLAPYAGRFQLFHLPFSRVLDIQESGPFHGVLADFGVSSDQIHETERGISFREDAPLDMRMDESAERTADEVVNEY
ncbi:MAG: 16S rRNA (cytosine(1402)-N(4))-methyltransferase, partial [Bdellovibrionales bacterium]|nr:16S rRNA (cytosine(1402)-N(4))-methyltransferase [Bdellovibrionales bacterium]